MDVRATGSRLGRRCGDRPLGNKGQLARSLDELVDGLAGSASSGDQVLIMSNGGFGGLHGKLLEALARGG